MNTRYKAKTIMPVDAVIWNGENIAEIQNLCPEVQIPETGTMLVIPTDQGPAEIYVGNVIMKNVGTGKYSGLDADVFFGLYEPMQEVTQQPI
jgi:hypothetical protein